MEELDVLQNIGYLSVLKHGFFFDLINYTNSEE
jgi:hypothetical protein